MARIENLRGEFGEICTATVVRRFWPLPETRRDVITDAGILWFWCDTGLRVDSGGTKDALDGAMRLRLIRAMQERAGTRNAALAERGT